MTSMWIQWKLSVHAFLPRNNDNKFLKVFLSLHATVRIRVCLVPHLSILVFTESHKIFNLNDELKDLTQFIATSIRVGGVSNHQSARTNSQSEFAQISQITVKKFAVRPALIFCVRLFASRMMMKTEEK